LIVHQQRRVFTHPRGPQVERRRHGTWVTGEVAVAALLITPAFIGAADVGDAPAKPMRWSSEPAQQSFALSPLVVGLPVREASWIGVCKFDHSS
jgi:hypothetical protein